MHATRACFACEAKVPYAMVAHHFENCTSMVEAVAHPEPEEDCKSGAESWKKAYVNLGRLLVSTRSLGGRGCFRIRPSHTLAGGGGGEQEGQLAGEPLLSSSFALLLECGEA